MTRFCHYTLRTTDVAAARGFYATVLGRDDAAIVPLHEQALARGARPHWLGQLGVADAEATARAWVERGATRLGPTAATRNGGALAIVRDGGGALVGLLSPPPPAAPTSPVVWHVLLVAGAERAAADYGALFGWTLGDRLDLGAGGRFHEFAWSPNGASVGAIGDLAGRPEVHAQWLFCFATATLEPALAAVRAAGGVVIPPLQLPNGARVAVCDDAQGAAFALYQAA